MIYEITGLAALVMIAAGIYLQYGAAVALMVCGALLLVMSIVGAKNNRHDVS
ncbi:MAG: hypothetical protein M0Q95_11075 [Porticoccaceae bacterium]|nr:hypothetical protein [Porticoccaceae bacterium]